MISIFWTLLPVFLVIVVGWTLRRFHVIKDEHWQGLDRLCYFVLFPTIFFKEIAVADFSSVPVFQMALAMMLAVSVMFAALIASHRLIMAAFGLNGPQFTSFLQGAIRWHTFIAFAIIPLQFGSKALSLGALSVAAMTPLVNILCVIAMSRLARESAMSSREMTIAIIGNPFVFSSLGGAAWHILGLPLPEAGLQVLDMIGRGALGLALLTVGAGLRIEQTITSWPPIAAAVVLKLLVMPIVMAAALGLAGVTGEAYAVAMLCAAVPTGSGAYVLAKQMGGDAPLVANILTLQVIAAAVTIPLVLGMVPG